MINVEGWDRERGCGRGGPYIARAVHSPGRLHEVLVSVGCRLSDQSLRGVLAQGSQQTLHDRMLLRAELVGVEFGETTDDGDRSQLWFGREPALDQRHVRIEL